MSDIASQLSRHGMGWTGDDLLRLAVAVTRGWTAPVIAGLLGRTRSAVEYKLRSLQEDSPCMWERLREEAKQHVNNEWLQQLKRQDRVEQAMRMANDPLNTCADLVDPIRSYAEAQAAEQARSQQSYPEVLVMPTRGPYNIPMLCVDDLVLMLTNEGSFYTKIVNLVNEYRDASQYDDDEAKAALARNQYERRIDLRICALVEQELKQQLPVKNGMPVYKSGWGDTYELDRLWIMAVARDIIASYRDNIYWTAADDARLAMVITQWQPGLRDLRIAVEYTYRCQHKRVPLDFIERQLLRYFSIGWGHVPVIEVDPDTQGFISLGAEDTRRLCKRVREHAEQWCNIKNAETLDETGTVQEDVPIPASASMCLLDPELNKQRILDDMNAEFDREMVIETGTKGRAAHQQLVNDTASAACRAIQDYMNKAAAELASTGSIKNLKPLEIVVAANQTKRYDDALRVLQHMHGDVIGNSGDVQFLLATAEDNTPMLVKKVTVNVA